MLKLADLKKDLRTQASPAKAKILQGFFKTNKGDYGHGDVFIGVTVPNTRAVAKKYSNIALTDVQRLLQSNIHEERLAALLLLVQKYNLAQKNKQKIIVDFYLKSTKRINNWDLVDLSADRILGEFLLNKSRSILITLARSKSLWERRIAIIATFRFIKNGDFSDTLKIAKLLLFDSHDLIHKAVGWMLREVGKRNLEEEEKFLKLHYKIMPRTMLRYAIEKFPESKRQRYLKGNI